MKTIRLLLCALPLIAFVRAQDPNQPEPDALTTEVFAPRLTTEQLDQLLGPIALYPDALIAIILPACTAPADVVLAARHLRDNAADLSQVESRTWDDSVKSLTHYPDVVKWLDENLPWTQQVGEAFVAQPAEVMQSIQRLRAKARAAGTLVDTPQQVVMAEPEAIRIVPAQSDIIYVPYYDPAVVYLEQPIAYYTRPFVSFSTGFAVGPWLAYDFDWRDRTIWVGNRYRSWYRHDWRFPVIPIRPPLARIAPPSRPWRPTPRLHRPWYSDNRDSLHQGTGVWQRSVPHTAPSAQTRSRTFAAPRSGSGGLTFSPAPETGRSRTAPGNSRTDPATPRTHTGRAIVPPPTSAPVLPSSRGNNANSQARGEARVTTRPAASPAAPPAATPPANAFSRRSPSSSSTVMRPVTPRTHAPGTLRTDTAGSPRTFAARTPRVDAQSSLRTFAPNSSRTHAQSTARTTPPSGSRTSRVASPPPSPTAGVKSARDSTDSATPAAAAGNRTRFTSGPRQANGRTL